MSTPPSLLPHRVVLSVPALAENFWEVVAARVGNGHSAAECSSRYAEINRRQKRKKAGRGTSKDKSTGPCVHMCVHAFVLKCCYFQPLQAHLLPSLLEWVQ